jgi:hypothetical protein
MSEAEGPLEKRIKWDEEVINEHNKERGTRQKVDLKFYSFKLHSFL